MRQLLKIYTIPQFEDTDLNRTTRIFFFIAYVLLIPLPINFAVIAVEDAPLEAKLVNAAASIIFFFTMSTLMYLAHRGRGRLAAGIMLVYVWGSLLAILLANRVDVRAANYSWFLLVILIAGLTIGNRGSLVFTVASIIVITAIFLVDVAGTATFTLPSYLFGWSLHAVGYVVGAVFVGAAVREGRLALERAQRSEMRWRSLVDNIPDWVIQLDAEHNIIYVNAPQSSPQHHRWFGRKFEDLAPPQYYDFIAQHLAQVCGQQRVQSFEIEIADTPGVNRWHRVTATPLQREMGAGALLLLVRDITEEKRVEAHERDLALVRTRNQTLKDAISELSHDMKTPLTTLTTSMFLLQHELDPQASNPRFAALQGQIDGLTETINSLLTIARLDRVDQSLFEPVDMHVLSEQVVTQIETLAANRSIQLTRDIQLTPNTTVDGMQSELRRVLQNLLENAINYTLEGGQVWLRVHHADANIVVEVQDTGIGIPPDALEKIFDRHYRTNRSQQLRASGTGLGLAIVKKIIDLHGGTIHVESQPDKGTLFRLHLPQSRALLAVAQ